MPKHPVWVCDRCSLRVTDYRGNKEVLHRCKDGRRNIPMELQTTDEEKK